MPITLNDIKLLRSERFNDDGDGGGFPIYQPIQDNVENNIFPDVSTLDRAQGALDLRKFYAAVTTASQDVYFGAHLVIDGVPSDPAIDCVLLPALSFDEVRDDLKNATTGAHARKFYGTKPLKSAVAPGQSVFKTEGLTARFLPTSSTLAPTSGAAQLSTVAGGAFESANALFSVGAPLPLDTVDLSPALSIVGTRMRLFAGEISGTINFGATALELTNGIEAASGLPVIYRDGVYAGIAEGPKQVWVGNGAPSSGDATYQPALLVTGLPREIAEQTYTAGAPAIMEITLPHFSEPGSEVVEFQASSGEQVRLENPYGEDTFVKHLGNSAFIDRALKKVTVALWLLPRAGSSVRVSYARQGYLQSLPASEVTTFSMGVATLDIPAGYSMRSAAWRMSGQPHFYSLQENGQVLRYSTPSATGVGLPMNTEPTVVGALTGGTTLNIPGLTGSVVDWRAVVVSNAIPSPTGQTLKATLQPDLAPGSLEIAGTLVPSGTAWTATANAAGEFSTSVVEGYYDPVSGEITLDFLESASASITYTADKVTYTAAPDEVTGLESARFASNGRVQVFRTGDVAVVHNTVALAPRTVANAEVVATRPNIAAVRVVGNDGVEITAGFSVNKTTGDVTFGSVAGYSQPVTISSRIELIALVNKATAVGEITLSKPAAHNFPADSSYVSSALVLNDLQGRARLGFQQATWLGHWLDEPEGSGILADFNEALHPITTTNAGAITERWAVRFLSPSTFEVFGETVGLIATGSTGANCSPNNPAAGAPYFTIPALAWGGGWATGNVYRFDTVAAMSPGWLARCTQPSDPFGEDRVTVSLRGDIDA